MRLRSESRTISRITSYNVCYTKLLREIPIDHWVLEFDTDDLEQAIRAGWGDHGPAAGSVGALIRLSSVAMIAS